MLLLDRLGARPATALRLAGLLGFVYWQSQALHPLGLHGRGLALTILLAVTGLAWAVWAWSHGDGASTDRGLSWDVFLLAAGGGLMVGASPEGPGNVFVFVAAFTAGARESIPRAFLVTGTAIVAVAGSWVLNGTGGLGALAYSLGLIATTFGGAQRHDAIARRETAELLLAQAQRSHEEALRNARLQESSRVAREVHDVLAHALAGLTIQLEATAALIETGADPTTILERVRRAHERARDGLRETRRAVGALRGDGPPAVPAAVRIEALVGDFRAAGGTIDLVLDDARERLVGAVGDAAVRILQEALTNVIKHAPQAAVSVTVTAGPPLSLTIVDETPAGREAPHATLSASGGGYGIAGMRERAHELGGHLSAGPTRGGWRVQALLEPDAGRARAR